MQSSGRGGVCRVSARAAGPCLAANLFFSLLLLAQRDRSSWQGDLLCVVLRVQSGLDAEVKEGHLAPGSFADTKTEDGRSDSGGDIECTFLSGPPVAIEPVDVSVAGGVTDQEVVKSGDGDVSGVRVSGEHERHAGTPEPGGFFGDVREADGREVGPQAAQGLSGIGMARVGVVQSDELEPVTADAHGGVRVVEERDSGPVQGATDFPRS